MRGTVRMSTLMGGLCGHHTVQDCTTTTPTAVGPELVSGAKFKIRHRRCQRHHRGAARHRQRELQCRLQGHWDRGSLGLGLGLGLRVLDLVLLRPVPLALLPEYLAPVALVVLSLPLEHLFLQARNL